MAHWEASRSPDAATSIELSQESDGYFSALAPEASIGCLYGFRLDDDPALYPDPASRYQPDGPHGPSLVVDPSSYEWQDGDWQGRELCGQVIYEFHVGTFTPEGTWKAAERELPRLAEMGITVLEMMPVADFAGRFGWGYDGVDFFAPTRLYGTPDELRHFVDAAHRAGLAVILDVVYNHFGPTGNYLGKFSAHYLSHEHRTDWGDAVNYCDAHCQAVREFVISNAGYWVDEYHFDGLRLDAVHAIVDTSEDHVLAALTRAVREKARGRQTIVIAENEHQDTRLLRAAEQGGLGLDAEFNDDFHHAARVAMTGHNDYYFSDYQGTPQELISAIKWGYLYQGQWNIRQSRRRGTPALDLRGEQFIVCLQNHDQVGNSPGGQRVDQLTSPGRYRALTAVTLLAPSTPLLFQGQEYGARTPFFYFADHEDELRVLVREGRQRELAQFRHLAGADAAGSFADPCDTRTFERSKLDPAEQKKHPEMVTLHRDLLRLRREDSVFSAQRSDRVHGAVLASEAFLLRYLGEDGDDRLLLVNLGRDVRLNPVTEPLLAPPAECDWQLMWSSEHPKYGGLGTAPLDPNGWFLPGHATLVLRSWPAQ